jgi:hypothetical protein
VTRARYCSAVMMPPGVNGSLLGACEERPGLTGRLNRAMDLSEA